MSNYKIEEINSKFWKVRVLSIILLLIPLQSSVRTVNTCIRSRIYTSFYRNQPHNPGFEFSKILSKIQGYTSSVSCFSPQPIRIESAHNREKKTIHPKGTGPDSTDPRGIPPGEFLPSPIFTSELFNYLYSETRMQRSAKHRCLERRSVSVPGAHCYTRLFR